VIKCLVGVIRGRQKKNVCSVVMKIETIFSSFVATVEEHGGQLCSFVVWLVLFVGMM
jgi:hypothetical protein